MIVYAFISNSKSRSNEMTVYLFGEKSNRRTYVAFVCGILFAESIRLS